MKTILILILGLASAPALACDGTEMEIPACRQVKRNLAELERKLSYYRLANDKVKQANLIKLFLEENENDLKTILRKGNVTRVEAINNLKQFSTYTNEVHPSIAKQLVEDVLPKIDKNLSAANKYANFIANEIIGQGLLNYETKALEYLSGEMGNLVKFRITYDQALKYVGSETAMARVVDGSEEARHLAEGHVRDLRVKSIKAGGSPEAIKIYQQADSIEKNVLTRTTKGAYGSAGTWQKIFGKVFSAGVR